MSVESGRFMYSAISDSTYVVMAYIVMACIVLAYSSYGRFGYSDVTDSTYMIVVKSYGQYSHGLYRYALL